MEKNKYQEALNKIIRSCCPYCYDDNGCQNCEIKQTCNATAKSWVDTLQELEDTLQELEDQLGIDLLTLFKAIETKIYAEAYHYKTGKPSILDFEEPRLIKYEEWCLVGTCGTFTYCVALKDFNKTWWIEKPKENDDE